MELFDICDEKGIPTGKTVERGIAHRDGILHRTSHVWIVRKERKEQNGKQVLKERDGWQILLQKRSLNKDSFPGMYDTSSAGHIPAGDEPLESALRELREELGLAADPADLHFAGNFRVHFALPFHGELFKDDEIVFVYVYGEPVEIEDIVVQKEELDEVRWFDLQEVYDECKRGERDRFCVPTEGLELLIRYLSSGGMKD